MRKREPINVWHGELFTHVFPRFGDFSRGFPPSPPLSLSLSLPVSLCRVVSPVKLASKLATNNIGNSRATILGNIVHDVTCLEPFPIALKKKVALSRIKTTSPGHDDQA